MLQYGYRTHDIGLELNLADALPPITADGDQIGQIVMNLLVNAQQALAGIEGPRRVRVQTGLEARREGREPRVWLRVADNGMGISTAARARIFEPFFTTKAEGMGTGLGLSVSRSLARDHGGELAIEREAADGGASFRLSLPISGVNAAAADTGPAPLIDFGSPHQARVLVVDDEPELAGVMRDMLEGAGYEVATADSGALALEMLATVRFDAIVSDLRMPQMDGAALWREISERHPALVRSILFVTGDTLSPDASAFLRRSRCASLDKPSARPICWSAWRRWWSADSGCRAGRRRLPGPFLHRAAEQAVGGQPGLPHLGREGLAEALGQRCRSGPGRRCRSARRARRSRHAGRPGCAAPQDQVGPVQHRDGVADHRHQPLALAGHVAPEQLAQAGVGREELVVEDGRRGGGDRLDEGEAAADEGDLLGVHGGSLL